ncbi:hypothetical protein O3P69_018584 [Scylla paramamosain]|uniref:WAP domain-containing protein n=1 Tax=Scylla paramamosain TaxID=85552 RepID=A0AAW0T284_SCYPA
MRLRRVVRISDEQHRGLCLLAVVMAAACVTSSDAGSTCNTQCEHPLGPPGHYTSICCDGEYKLSLVCQDGEDTQHRGLCLLAVVMAAACVTSSDAGSTCNTQCEHPLGPPGHYICCDARSEVGGSAAKSREGLRLNVAGGCGKQSRSCGVLQAHRGLSLLLVVMVAVCVTTIHASSFCRKQCQHPRKPPGHYLCCDKNPGTCPKPPRCNTSSRNRVVCLMVVMVAAALSVASPSPSCNTHCPDPYLNVPGHYVCCDQHPGKCPPVPHCPAYPRKCFYDPECGLNEKCCNTPCGGKRPLCPPSISWSSWSSRATAFEAQGVKTGHKSLKDCPGAKGNSKHYVGRLQNIKRIRDTDRDWLPHGSGCDSCMPRPRRPASTRYPRPPPCPPNPCLEASSCES